LLIINKELNAAQFTSISSFDIYNYGVKLDLDAASGEFAHRISSSDIDVFSQEFRLASNTDDKLSWLAGITFSEERFEERRQFLFRDNFLVIASQGLSFGNVDYDQNTSSHSLYGNMHYTINSEWAVNFSLRYTDEEKEYRNGRLFVPGAVPFVIFNNLSRDYKLENNLSGNIGLEWLPEESILVYASISDGFKSGGFYGGFPSLPEEIDPYKEETMTAYEIGIKKDFSSTLRLNGAAFYYDYEDVQGFISRLSAITNTAINVLSNQGGAEHSGVEMDLDWFPTDNLNIGINLGYLDARSKNSSITTLDIFQNAVPVSGRRAYAPLWSGDISSMYQFSIIGNLRSSFSLYYNFRTKFSGSQPNSVEEAIYKLDGYNIFDANLDVYEVDDDWKLSLWVKNIFDKNYRTRVKSDGLLSYADLFGQPRSVGAALELRW
jgi:iron complex outermembrane recepter protein